MKNVIADLNLYNHDNILDIGTGKGQFINDIIKIFPNHKSIIGIDPNEESIKHAKEIFHTYEKVNFLVKNTDATDFEDNSFDVITLSNTIHHLPPGNKLFKEIERLLKPNGVLFIIELYSDGDQSEKQMTHILQHHFRAEVDTKSGIFHDFTFSRQRIIDFVEEQKIVIDHTYDFSDTERMNSSNPQYYKSVVEGINQTLKKVESLPYLDDIKSRGNDILTRIENSGFMMPNQIIITGRFKKNN